MSRGGRHDTGDYLSIIVGALREEGTQELVGGHLTGGLFYLCRVGGKEELTRSRTGVGRGFPAKWAEAKDGGRAGGNLGELDPAHVGCSFSFRMV